VVGFEGVNISIFKKLQLFVGNMAILYRQCLFNQNLSTSHDRNLSAKEWHLGVVQTTHTFLFGLKNNEE